MATSPFTDTTCGSTLPVKKKAMKPDVVKKLLKRAVMGIISDNPVGTLNSLVEKESFRIEIVAHEKEEHKCLVYIDGKVFESVATQKKKARDLAVIRALRHVFRDVIQELSNNEVARTPHEIISTAATINATLESISKSTKLHVNEKQNGNCVKKVKIGCSDANCGQLVFRKDLKPSIAERVVQQALSNCENPNTVTALYTLFENDSFHFQVESVTDTDAPAPFQAVLQINGKNYTDYGTSMRKAKSNVTKKVLQDLFPQIARGEKLTSEYVPSENGALIKAEKTRPVVDSNVNVFDSTSYTSPDSVAPAIQPEYEEVRNVFDSTSHTSSDFVAPAIEPEDEEVMNVLDSTSHTFPDFVACAIQSKYEEVMASKGEHLKRYSVLSGILMVQNDDLNTSSVICVCTG